MLIYTGNKKSDIRKKCVFFVGLLVLTILVAGAEPEQKDLLGVYSGWSFSLGNIFMDDSLGGHTFNHYMPNLILGAYWQRNFSRSFGLQFNANYQKCSNDRVYHVGKWRAEETETVDSFSVNLNGILTVIRPAMAEIYLLGGIGLFTGPFDNKKTFLQFSGGTGVRFRVKSGSRIFVNLAAVFHHFQYQNNGAQSANYLRLQAGLEFHLNKKWDNH